MKTESTIAISSLFMGFIVGMLLGLWIDEKEIRREAVLHGAATYVIENGLPVFKWNDKVKK